ncbi:AMP-binding protein [Pontibacter sp. SGAir0037]|uniref:AMP-binding protein n=1 Tax=Pontibacter sp. SGAir0037 TaxID=2571030 RepID=UPI0010CCC83D|nr:AMP-binding protein [Pontibacter sp. SGAir0037]QCR21494.1 acyl-CoA synthetase [Pontibacter sp. SGAir0037]
MAPEKALLLNGKKFYYDEIADYSFRNSIPLNGYEAKTLEFCRSWLTGVQEFPIQTSGSTGEPKRIHLSRKQLEISARRTIKLLGLREYDQTLICLNTDYIAGLMMLVRGFEAGLQMFIVEPVSNPFKLLPEGTRIDFASFVPLQLQTILEDVTYGPAVLNGMKGILVGGAPVGLSLQRKLQQLKTPVYHTYGMTETASHIALRLLNGPKAAEYYEVLDSIQIGQDKRGCLTITGDITSNETIVTNDLVELLTPTRFRWIGRVDNTINSGGVKIQSEKVEVAIAEALMELPQQPRFFVAPQPDELLGEKIVLLIEGEKLPEEVEQTLFTKLKTLLQKFEVPRELYYSPSFSETNTGKVSKQKTLQKLGLEPI